MNPVAADVGLKLNISKYDNSQDLLLAKEIAKYFRIKPNKVETLIQEMIDAVKSWKEEASTMGITISEQNRMARAFRIVNGK